nr:MAG TPA: hypothetical protein [Caudoviricetes sp.]
MDLFSGESIETENMITFLLHECNNNKIMLDFFNF